MLRAMGDGFVPWRCVKVPVELEGTCGANLGWGRAEERRKREKEEKAYFTVPLDCGVYGGGHGGGIQIQSTYGGGREGVDNGVSENGGKEGGEGTGGNTAQGGVSGIQLEQKRVRAVAEGAIK